MAHANVTGIGAYPGGVMAATDTHVVSAPNIDWTKTKFAQQALLKLVGLSSVVEDIFENQLSIVPRMMSDYSGLGFRCEISEQKLWMNPENRTVYSQQLLEANLDDKDNSELKESTQVIAVMRMLYGATIFRSDPDQYNPMTIHQAPKEPNDYEREFLRQTAKDIVAGKKITEDILPKLALMKFSKRDAP